MEHRMLQDNFLTLTLRRNVLILSLVLCLARNSSLSKSTYETDTTDSQRLQYGKEQYEIIKKDSEAPRYGQCWKGALAKLEAGCKVLTDDVQHRLALSFTTCYMEKMGRKGYPCGDKEDISECTKDMDPTAFNTMTSFFTHTQNICFFLQSQIWQERTDETVSRLAETSDNVVNKLEESSNLQETLLTQQNASLKNQQEMIQKSQSLATHIESSSNNIHVLMKEFQDSTHEQRLMLTDVFDRVAKLQSIMVGEFTGFYSFIFYTLSILVCYLLTSTQRTSGARFFLFAVMTLDVIVERFIISYYSTENKSSIEASLSDTNSLMYSRLWLCRKFFLVISLLVLVICSLRYRDYNKINNCLLVEIKKQNSELKHLLRPSSLDYVDSTEIAALPNQHGTAMITQGNSPGVLGLSRPGGEESSDDDDTSSSDLESDYTFVADEDSGNDSDVSVMTQSSQQSLSSALDELEYLHSSTPMREMTPTRRSLRGSVSRESSPAPSSISGYNTPRSQGRPRQRSSTPVMDGRPGLERYNLRHRQPPSSPNPVLTRETEKDFYKMVKHLSGIVQRNAVKTRYTIERTNQSGFSSGGDQIRH